VKNREKKLRRKQQLPVVFQERFYFDESRKKMRRGEEREKELRENAIIFSYDAGETIKTRK